MGLHQQMQQNSGRIGMKYTILKIQEHGEWMEAAAEWFHQKWQIPREAYVDSMDMCLQKKSAVPQWYIVLDGKRIVAGIGVIENDFHNRKDLAPNVCAVYVEEAYRNQGIAGEMLRYVCDDLYEKGIDILYHDSFYERYGWEFLCMVQGDGEPEMTRMYRHREKRNRNPDKENL